MANGPTIGAKTKSFLLLTLIGSAGLAGLVCAQGKVETGARLFAANCARCHGRGGKGNGPDLVKLQSAVSPDDWTDKESNQELTDQFVVAMITKGGKANGKSRIMPAFSDKLNALQVQDLLAFIRSLAR